MFEAFFQKIGSVIITVGMIIGGWLGGTPQDKLGASVSTPSAIALFETTLASRITDTATTLTLTSATDKDGTALASSTYGMIIDEGTASEELVLADCTSTACTNLTRGLSVRTGTTSVTALKFEHRRGASVKITDAPALIFATNVFRGRQNIENALKYDSNVLTSATGTRILVDATFVGGFTNVASTSAFNSIVAGTTITGTTTFTNGAEWNQVCSDGQDLCNKTYVDGVAVAGASDANTTTKGIVEEATLAEINSSSATGGTGAKLVMTPATFALSNFASATPTTYSTTTSVNLATSTITSDLIPSTDKIIIDIIASSTGAGGATYAPRFTFNEDYTAKYSYLTVDNGGAAGGSSGATTQIVLTPLIGDRHFYIHLEIFNLSSSFYKYGTIHTYTVRNSDVLPVDIEVGSFLWQNTGRITSISMDYASTTALITAGARFNITGY